MDQDRTITGCLLVGEYVDEANGPDKSAPRGGESVPTEVVARFVDVWVHDAGTREFTVLLKDGRVIAVRGHTLKNEPHSLAGEGTYSIVLRSNEGEVVVALFKSAEVAGIFHGSVRSDRKIA